MRYRLSQGFTLVEVAVVLIIAGLLMGMAFKGKVLVDMARVRHIGAQYAKVGAASALYQEMHGVRPGDGCVLANAGTTGDPEASAGQAQRRVDCDKAADGELTEGELNAYLPALVQTGLLQGSDIKGNLGSTWQVNKSATQAYLGRERYYLALAKPVDGRIVCALDQQIDDGVAAQGQVRSDQNYTATDDCWKTSGKAVLALELN